MRSLERPFLCLLQQGQSWGLPCFTIKNHGSGAGFESLKGSSHSLSLKQIVQTLLPTFSSNIPITTRIYTPVTMPTNVH